jgi:filamentous hemagglutinin
MMDSNDKLTIEGASIYTNGNLYLRGRNGVELRPGMASSYYLEVYKKSGLSANLSIGKGGLSAGIGYGKMKSVYEEKRLDVIKNQIYAGGNYTVVSENGNYNQTSTDIDVIGNASITAKDIIIGDAQSKVEIKQEQKSSYTGIGVTIGIPIVSSAIAIVDDAKGLAKASNTEGLITAGSSAAVTGQNYSSSSSSYVSSGNAKTMYDKYEAAGWKGNVSGQTKRTRAGGIWENNNGELPAIDSAGNAIIYRKFDVNNRRDGANRDTERFIRGSDGSVYYTNDHYTTIFKIK